MAGLLAAALLIVVVHNPASVPDATIGSAKVEIERIYASANISIAWSSSIAPGTFGIQVVLRREPAGGPGAMAPSALGTTVGDDHSSGGSCFVFYQRVLKFAHQHNRPVEVIWPTRSHTSSGMWCCRHRRTHRRA
jgi:hypothetical protein